MKYPDAFKISFFCPIHRTGDIDNLENHRLNSIISAIAEIYDKLLHENIISRTSHLITPSQHGITVDRSVTTILLEYIDSLSGNVMNGGQVDAIYTDLAEALTK